MSENTTVFTNNNLSSKIVSTGLADNLVDNLNRNKPNVNIATNTPLPRPGGVSTSPNMSSSTVANSTSMGAVNRSRSNVDPLASATMSENMEVTSESHTPPQEEKVDPVEVCTNQFLSKICNPPVNVSLISRNISGLHILASCNAWSHVVELSMELLKGNPQSAYADDSSLSVIFVFRMVGLFRLKMLDELQYETSSAMAIEESKLLTHLNGVDTDMDADQAGLGTFLQFPMPPLDSLCLDNIISLQLLLTEVKFVTGHSDEAVNLLYTLRKWLTESENAKKLSSGDDQCSRCLMWKWKVMWSLINVLLRQRLWRQGIKEMLTLLREVHDMKRISGVESSMKSKLTCAEIIILCRISRTLIQVGALQSASSYLEKAQKLCDGHDDDKTSQAVLEIHVNVAKGLLCFSLDQFVEACDLFKNVVDCAITTRSMVSTGNFMLEEERYSDSGTNELSPDSDINLLNHPCGGVVEMEENLLPIAVNNFAVCSLHLRKIKAAVEKIEELIQDDPAKHMIDPIIFNLCTMYDLSFGPEVSAQKKKSLKIISEKYHIDDISWKSFRL